MQDLDPDVQKVEERVRRAADPIATASPALCRTRTTPVGISTNHLDLCPPAAATGIHHTSPRRVAVALVVHGPPAALIPLLAPRMVRPGFAVVVVVRKARSILAHAHRPTNCPVYAVRLVISVALHDYAIAALVAAYILINRVCTHNLATNKITVIYCAIVVVVAWILIWRHVTWVWRLLRRTRRWRVAGGSAVTLVAKSDAFVSSRTSTS